MTIDRRIESARQVLRVAFGLVPFLAGLDKFFNLLTDWPRYLSPAAEAILPVTGQTFMYFAGGGEMVVGLAILTRWTMIGSYVAAAWLGPIVITWEEVIGRLVLATVLGAIVGAERERRERAAGLRTHALVGVGAALFIL